MLTWDDLGRVGSIDDELCSLFSGGAGTKGSVEILFCMTAAVIYRCSYDPLPHRLVSYAFFKRLDQDHADWLSHHGPGQPRVRPVFFKSPS